MAYKFKAADSSIETAVRRIAHGQVDKAIAAIDEKEAGKAVHEVRKTCKKVRGLIRLVRPAMPAYAEANKRFRDIARSLSQSRDSKVMLDTFDLLAGDARAEDSESLASLRAHFASAAESIVDDPAAEPLLGEARAELVRARSEITEWSLEAEGWDAIGGGMGKVLAKAGKAARKLRKHPDAEHYHELRKLMKYHWYHCRLLVPIWPRMMEARAQELSELADTLGLHHDVCVFRNRIDDVPGSAEAARELMISLADRRGAMLERDAAPGIARLLEQSADTVADHWHGLWTIWRSGCADD